MHNADSPTVPSEQLDANAAAIAVTDSTSLSCVDTSSPALSPAVNAVASGIAGISMTGCGLVVANTEISPAEFNTLFHNVLGLHKSSCWLLGDVLLLGDNRWGSRITKDKYAEAMAATGLSANTLQRIVLTCRRFPVHTRHPELSFTHHQEVAATDADPDQRAAVLEQAAQEKMSCTALRKHLHKTRFNETEEEKAERQANTRSDIDGHFIDPENPLSIINLPERVSPDAPPLWDAYKFVGWAAQQAPEDYTREQCEQAIKLCEPLVEYYEAVCERMKELNDLENA